MPTREEIRDRLSAQTLAKIQEERKENGIEIIQQEKKPLNQPVEVISPNGQKQNLLHKVLATVHFKVGGHAPVVLNLETPHEFMVPVVNDKNQITLVDMAVTTWGFFFGGIFFVQKERG